MDKTKNTTCKVVKMRFKSIPQTPVYICFGGTEKIVQKWPEPVVWWTIKDWEKIMSALISFGDGMDIKRKSVEVFKFRAKQLGVKIKEIVL
jgi:hypothetical protein